MGKGKITEKILVIVLMLALAFAGGTARLRPNAAEKPPAPAQQTAQTPAPAAQTPAQQPEQTAAVTPPTQTPAPTPTPEPELYTFHFIGDCTLAANAAHQGTSDGYDTVINGDFSYPFAKTKQYFIDDDFTMANLECALTEERSARVKTFTFRTSADYAQILPEGGVEFVTLANNHVLDFGQKGYEDTKAAAAAAGLAYAGRDEWTIYETARGLKIGVYAVSSFGTDRENREAPELIKKGVAAVRAAGAEFVIAALHFGDEGSYQVNAVQREQAHAAIDAGADFVYGSHAHTLQPYEEYKGHYIYYCMGNWTFGGNTNPRDKDTFILEMTVERAHDGSVTVLERTHIPCASSGRTDTNNYQPVPYEKDSEGWKRVMSKLDGSWTGANLSIGYGYSSNE